MNDDEQRFWDLADQLIGTANQLSESADRSLVADALMFAAARYGAYLAASSAESRKEFKEEQEELKGMLMEQFAMMLDSNFADYLENYKLYIERSGLDS